MDPPYALKVCNIVFNVSKTIILLKVLIKINEKRLELLKYLTQHIKIGVKDFSLKILFKNSRYNLIEVDKAFRDFRAEIFFTFSAEKLFT